MKPWLLMQETVDTGIFNKKIKLLNISISLHRCCCTCWSPPAVYFQPQLSYVSSQIRSVMDPLAKSLQISIQEHKGTTKFCEESNLEMRLHTQLESKILWGHTRLYIMVGVVSYTSFGVLDLVKIISIVALDRMFQNWLGDQPSCC